MPLVWARQTAQGHEDIEAPDFSDVWDDLDVEGDVSASDLIQLGQAAVAKQMYPLAARAFRIAVERLDDPLAPKACVLLRD